MAVRKGGLGRGLDALFVDNTTSDSGAIQIALSEIEPNKDQPRKNFDEEALAELAASIREHGVIQPLLVRPLNTGRYQLVAGERRWRASRMAGLTKVPVVIRELTDSEVMEIALIENLQREDLNPIEEALGYRQLLERHDMTQEQVAARVGKSRPVVANAIRLLNLPEEVVAMVRDGEISSGHARALLALAVPEAIMEAAVRVRDEKLSVRDIEHMAKAGKSAKKPMKPSSKLQENSWGDPFYREFELALVNELGRKVTIKEDKDGKGMLEIAFFNKEDLAILAEKLAGGKKV